ncbi:hypothetical protein C5167_040912 [Papaver somniferum]|uniref:Fe2OG dioxygenase domain-containing protein n=1 Tax=Papaver somniferum TaxID=3469 RepID=A0A4Y7IJS2_PAPSO|nr:1-aminocyclopropane-1-carboxylate oxidase homolog 1-like [Papaver somniferum]RZC47962.1 hypothetical protein C5167_040912 [Papaver somniferum]
MKITTGVRERLVYDRYVELKAFDETKAGVKGIVDAGIEKIPRMFIRPQDDLNGELAVHTEHGCSSFETPMIDLQGVKDNPERREEIVHEIQLASETLGFFQLVNHGVPVSVMSEIIDGVKRFHEQDTEIKKQLHSNGIANAVNFNSNFDLYVSKFANWRDTLKCNLLSPDPLDPRELPDTCRDIVVEYWKHIMELSNTLTELLSEALGLQQHHVRNLDCSECLSMNGHYYPACPEPELTLGTSKHSDPSLFTILLQDEIGGLQFLHQNHWASVKPIPGTFIVNIGDILQLISNGKFKSVEHRVLANHVGPRVSVACFVRPSMNRSTKLYGPIDELLSEGNPPVYREITFKEYASYSHSKGLNGDSALNYFRSSSYEVNTG